MEILYMLLGCFIGFYFSICHTQYIDFLRIEYLIYVMIRETLRKKIKYKTVDFEKSQKMRVKFKYTYECKHYDELIFLLKKYKQMNVLNFIQYEYDKKSFMFAFQSHQKLKYKKGDISSESLNVLEKEFNTQFINFVETSNTTIKNKVNRYIIFKPLFMVNGVR